MSRQVRKSTRDRKAGEYTEQPESVNIKPAFVLPDPEFDAELAPHCSFPSIPLNEGPGRSELFRMERDAKIEKKRLRRAEKMAVYRANRRAEKEFQRMRHGSASSSALVPSAAEPKPTEAEDKPKPKRPRGRPRKNQSAVVNKPENSETDSEDIVFSETSSDEGESSN